MSKKGADEVIELVSSESDDDITPITPPIPPKPTEEEVVYLSDDSDNDIVVDEVIDGEIVFEKKIERPFGRHRRRNRKSSQKVSNESETEPKIKIQVVTPVGTPVVTPVGTPVATPVVTPIVTPVVTPESKFNINANIANIELIAELQRKNEALERQLALQNNTVHKDITENRDNDQSLDENIELIDVNSETINNVNNDSVLVTNSDTTNAKQRAETLDTNAITCERNEDIVDDSATDTEEMTVITDNSSQSATDDTLCFPITSKLISHFNMTNVFQNSCQTETHFSQINATNVGNIAFNQNQRQTNDISSTESAVRRLSFSDAPVGEVYVCTYDNCNETFNNAVLHYKHEKKHLIELRLKGIPTFKCSFCSFSAFKQSELIYHNSEHRGIYLCRFTDCLHKSENPDTLNRHMNEKRPTH